MKNGVDLKNLTAKYSKMIYNIARRYLNTKEDAEDIVQEVFIEYIAEIKKGKVFDTDEYEKHWIIRVTINKCFNEINAAKRRKTLPLKESLYCELEISSENLLYECVNILKDIYKETFILFYIEDMKISEISKLLKISESNVKTRLRRARDKAEEYIKKGVERYERI